MSEETIRVIERAVERLPPSKLAANLFVVLGAHRNGALAEDALAGLLEEFCSNQLAALRS